MTTSSFQYLDFGIFLAFILANLGVGLMYSRSITSLRDYAVGGKDLSTAALVATIVATLSSGSSMFVILENTYDKGLYYVIARMGLPLSIWICGQLAARMAAFMDYVSIAEAMGSLYGKHVRMITAVCGILAFTGALAAQFKVITKILAMVLGIESTVVTIVAASAVITYSSLGGIKAVTFTDILQFCTFSIMLPILAFSIWNRIEPGQISATMASSHIFNVKEVVGWHPEFMTTIGLFFYYAIPGLAPTTFQRMVMAKNTQHLKRAFSYSAGILLLIFLLTAWISMLLFADNSSLTASQVISHLVDQHTYAGLRGLLGIGVLAFAMSTADSYLNACAVLFVNDLVRPIPSTKKEKVVKMARLFSFTMGFAALLLSLYSQDLLKLILFSGSLYMPVFTAPMLMAILGFRGTTRSVLMGMGAGFGTVVIWSFCYSNSGSVVPGMLANLLVLFGSHYLLGEPGGWTKAKPIRSML